jgi:hypothetical protein
MERLIISTLRQAKIETIDNQGIPLRSGCSAWENGTLADVSGRKMEFSPIFKISAKMECLIIRLL